MCYSLVPSGRWLIGSPDGVGTTNDFSRLDFERLWNGRGRVTEVEGTITRSLISSNVAGRALEAGAGNGRITNVLHDSFKEYYALDATPSFLEEIKCSHDGTRLVKINGDLLKTPFRDNSFDTVIMIRVFNFLPNPELALREFRRVLKPGGSLILSFYHTGSLAVMVDKFKAMGAGNGVAPIVERGKSRRVLCSQFLEFFYSRRYVNSMASDAGLVVSGTRSCGLEDYAPFHSLPSTLLINASRLPNVLGLMPHSFVRMIKRATGPVAGNGTDEIMACPDCHHGVDLESISSGKTDRCPGCGHSFEYRNGVMRV